MAMLAWQDAHSSAEFVKAHNSELPDPVFNGIGAGIVTLYSRPFMSGNGIGPISKEFEEFPKDKVGVKRHGYHLYMKILRNNVFAHFDSAANWTYLSSMPAVPPDGVVLDLNLQGCEISCETLIFGRQQLADVIDLLAFQRQRLQRKFEAALVAYYEGNVPLGRVRITADGTAPVKEPAAPVKEPAAAI